MALLVCDCNQKNLSLLLQAANQESPNKAVCLNCSPPPFQVESPQAVKSTGVDQLTLSCFCRSLSWDLPMESSRGALLISFFFLLLHTRMRGGLNGQQQFQSAAAILDQKGSLTWLMVLPMMARTTSKQGKITNKSVVLVVCEGEKLCAGFKPLSNHALNVVRISLNGCLEGGSNYLKNSLFRSVLFVPRTF